jgi:hypothetical protein
LDVPDHLSDGLANILARMVLSVIEGERRLVAWAIESEATLVQSCCCRARVGDLACACKVEPAVPRAYMIRAAARLELGQSLAKPPSRKCLLCLRGDHDLVETILVSLVGPEGDAVGSMRVAGWRRRSKKHEIERAERAHAFPAGTRESQRCAAGLVPDYRR